MQKKKLFLRGFLPAGKEMKRGRGTKGRKCKGKKEGPMLSFPLKDRKKIVTPKGQGRRRKKHCEEERKEGAR